MNCVNCDICVYHLGLCVCFPGIFLSFRVTGACPVTTDGLDYASECENNNNNSNNLFMRMKYITRANDLT